MLSTGRDRRQCRETPNMPAVGQSYRCLPHYAYITHISACLQELDLSWLPKRQQFFCHVPTELCHLSMKDKQNSFFSVLRQQNSISSYFAEKPLASVPLSSKTCCKTNCSTTWQKRKLECFPLYENCRLSNFLLQNSLEIIQSCQSPAVWRIKMDL